ncbi:hypothetical protein [Telmatospirillum sp.]|uniref:YncE family protein n=1 Tax=Telmatospirillum sp. TaxID=2079197 RepID=UPI0028434078|nr:hypothetical protein [Telmatospirillum sp.]MDR3435210.1 hypothetical protein [Telmatospirillum sp.]
MRFHASWRETTAVLGRAVLIVAGCCAGFANSAAAQTAFHVVETVALGAPDKWDYLSYDGPSRRVFLAHDSEITVLDGASGAIVGRVEGLVKAHGVAFVSRLQRGYATNDGRVTVFDLAILRPLAEITTDVGADSIVYDSTSNRLFVMNGKGHTVTAIDPDLNTATKTIDVGGKPEFAAADGQGALFVNVENTGEIIRLDTRAIAVTARWAIPGCEAPHGLALDHEEHRLFASCANARMAVVDAGSGAVLALLPIGKGSDAVLFDPERKIAFSSNGDATLSMIGAGEKGDWIVYPPVATVPGARTMAQDRRTGRIFLVAGDVGTTPSSIVAGSLKLLILDPL